MKLTVAPALCALLCVCPLARGAEPSAPAAASSEATSQAREHFQRGVEFYEEQSFDAALAEFSRAYELQANYRVLFNLGQVQLERHDYVAALKLFRDYLNAGADDIPSQRRDQVERDIGTLKQRVAELRVSSNVAGAELLIDGVSVGKTPLRAAILVNPGSLHAVLRKPGYASESRTVSVVGAESKELDIKLSSDAQAGVPAGATKGSQAVNTESIHVNRTPFWISVAVTGALAIGTGVFALRAHQANTDLDHELNASPDNADSISSARSRLKRDALVTDVLAGTTLLAGAVTVYFAFSSDKHGEQPAARVGMRPLARANGIELFANF